MSVIDQLSLTFKEILSDMLNRVSPVWLLIKKHPKPVAIIAVSISLLLVIILIAMALYEPPYRPPQQTWFYDTNTGKLFPSDFATHPPIDTPTGPDADGKPAGVQAYVFACGDCSIDADRFTAYLETYPPAAKKSLQALASQIESGIAPERQPALFEAATAQKVRRPDDKQWVASNSRDGQAIIKEASSNCGANKLNRCYPGDEREPG